MSDFTFLLICGSIVPGLPPVSGPPVTVVRIEDLSEANRAFEIGRFFLGVA